MPLQGHAVEARIYAEDPARGFLPSTGTLLALQFPDGVRVDTGVAQGSAITPYYDPMIAKMIAHAPTREAALGQAGVGAGAYDCGRPLHQSGAARGALPRGRVPRRKLRHRFHRTPHGGAFGRAAAIARRRHLAWPRCWRATSPASARASTARLTRQPRLGTRPTAFSFPARAHLRLPIQVDGEPAEAHVKYGADRPRGCCGWRAGRS